MYYLFISSLVFVLCYFYFNVSATTENYAYLHTLSLHYALPISAQAGPVVVCHCIDCQRRTGAPFGAGVFYPAGDVGIAGTTTEFTRKDRKSTRLNSSH